jgi:hypothetical protein
MTSFYYSGSYRLKINSGSIIRVNASCPDQMQEAKNLLDKTHTKTGRYSPKEHLDLLIAKNLIAEPSNTTFVFGIRNVMSNQRCIFYSESEISSDISPPYSVSGEIPLNSQRPYYIMAEDKKGKLLLNEYLPSKDSLSQYKWLFSGVPVLWDDLTFEELFKTMLTEASDHSHIYKIPRGENPEATDQTRNVWKRIHDVFVEQVHQNSENAYNELKKVIDEISSEGFRISREYNYNHSIMGIDSLGNFLLLIGTGKLEDLGQIMKKEMGAVRAICVENSGSITLLYYPKGILLPEISLFAVPNQRRSGTAFLVFEISDDRFSLL